MNLEASAIEREVLFAAADVSHGHGVCLYGTVVGLWAVGVGGVGRCAVFVWLEVVKYCLDILGSEGGGGGGGR